MTFEYLINCNYFSKSNNFRIIALFCKISVAICPASAFASGVSSTRKEAIPLIIYTFFRYVKLIFRIVHIYSTHYEDPFWLQLQLVI